MCVTGPRSSGRVTCRVTVKALKPARRRNGSSGSYAGATGSDRLRRSTAKPPLSEPRLDSELPVAPARARRRPSGWFHAESWSLTRICVFVFLSNSLAESRARAARASTGPGPGLVTAAGSVSLTQAAQRRLPGFRAAAGAVSESPQPPLLSFASSVGVIRIVRVTAARRE